jgi:hypothetical protein
MLKVGEEIGRYRLEASLGLGGMAEVFRARDLQLGRTVALKLVLPHLAARAELRDRFLREARLAASLEHPHIVPLYDFGAQATQPYLVMPWIEGGSLAERMRLSAVDPAQALGWLGEIAAALDHAHAAGVLHRDVKPANVLLDRHGRALLADFGIAFAIGSESRLTQTGTILGTPEYLAPELIEGQAASRASDLYAFAAMAYELLSGQPPFVGNSALSILHQHTTRPVPPIRGRVPELPEEVDAALARGLAKNPAERPRSCRELVRELAPGVEAGSVVPALVAGDAPTMPTPVPAPPPSPAPTRAGIGRWLAGALVVVGALVVGGLGYQAMRAPVEPEEALDVETSPNLATVTTPAAAAPAAETAAPASEPAPPTEPGLEPRGAPREPRRLAQRRAERTNGALGPRNPLAQRNSLDRRGPLDADRFEAMLARARGVLASRPEDPFAAAMARYAEGGLAYVAGDDTTAAAALVELAQLPRLPPALALPQRRMLTERPAGTPITAWELAVGYGDARDEGRAAVREHLAANPDDARAHAAAAFLERLHDPSPPVGPNGRRLRGRGEGAQTP